MLCFLRLLINGFSNEPYESFHLLRPLDTCRLLLVGQRVLGPVGELVVEVHEGALDLWQPLQLLLQGLADVMASWAYAYRRGRTM